MSLFEESPWFKEMEKLDSLLLHHIGAQLPQKAALQCRLVSKRWRDIFSHLIKQITVNGQDIPRFPFRAAHLAFPSTKILRVSNPGAAPGEAHSCCLRRILQGAADLVCSSVAVDFPTYLRFRKLTPLSSTTLNSRILSLKHLDVTFFASGKEMSRFAAELPVFCPNLEALRIYVASPQDYTYTSPLLDNPGFRKSAAQALQEPEVQSTMLCSTDLSPLCALAHLTHLVLPLPLCATQLSPRLLMDEPLVNRDQDRANVALQKRIQHQGCALLAGLGRLRSLHVYSEVDCVDPDVVVSLARLTNLEELCLPRVFCTHPSQLLPLSELQSLRAVHLGVGTEHWIPVGDLDVFCLLPNLRQISLSIDYGLGVEGGDDEDAELEQQLERADDWPVLLSGLPCLRSIILELRHGCGRNLGKALQDCQTHLLSAQIFIHDALQGSRHFFNGLGCCPITMLHISGPVDGGSGALMQPRDFEILARCSRLKELRLDVFIQPSDDDFWPTLGHIHHTAHTMLRHFNAQHIQNHTHHPILHHSPNATLSHAPGNPLLFLSCLPWLRNLAIHVAPPEIARRELPLVFDQLLSQINVAREAGVSGWDPISQVAGLEWWWAHGCGGEGSSGETQRCKEDLVSLNFCRPLSGQMKGSVGTDEGAGGGGGGGVQCAAAHPNEKGVQCADSALIMFTCGLTAGVIHCMKSLPLLRTLVTSGLGAPEA